MHTDFETRMELGLD